ncbi:MAG TPA: hypothetical protein PLV37_02325, partial [Bacillota bacterium]|nr:hypothetical protein [Bacillota bacterium]
MARGRQGDALFATPVVARGRFVCHPLPPSLARWQGDAWWQGWWQGDALFASLARDGKVARGRFVCHPCLFLCRGF